MKTLLSELSKVNTSTVFGQYIASNLSRGEQLVSELKDQLRDAPIELERAIGTKAIQLLKNAA